MRIKKILDTNWYLNNNEQPSILNLLQNMKKFLMVFCSTLLAQNIKLIYEKEPNHTMLNSFWFLKYTKKLLKQKLTDQEK